MMRHQICAPYSHMDQNCTLQLRDIMGKKKQSWQKWKNGFVFIVPAFWKVEEQYKKISFT